MLQNVNGMERGPGPSPHPLHCLSRPSTLSPDSNATSQILIRSFPIEPSLIKSLHRSQLKKLINVNHGTCLSQSHAGSCQEPISARPFRGKETKRRESGLIPLVTIRIFVFSHAANFTHHIPRSSSLTATSSRRSFLESFNSRPVSY
jgi:hypothetical protein